MHRLITISCLWALLSAPFYAEANNTASNSAIKNPSYAEASNKVEQIKNKELNQKRKELAEEAVIAVDETYKALEFLNEGNQQEARAALEKAAEKLEAILSRTPHLAIAPISVSTLTTNVVADPHKISTSVKEARKLLDDGQVQSARHSLLGLASETLISVNSIPLASYPNAIKEAEQLLDKGDIEGAQKILSTAVNSIVVTNTIIPIPYFMAQEMLKKAERLSEQANRSDADNRELNNLISAARREIGFAEVLGYGTKQDYKRMKRELDNIEKNIKGGKSLSGIFQNIKQYISESMLSIQEKTQSTQSK